jgi:uncharacterized protein YbjT (DUF2867 family)
MAREKETVMRVAVAGGTGVAGSRAVEALSRAGHEPVVVTRSAGVDLTQGMGLDAALDGVEAVVDASNVVTLDRRRSSQFFTTTTRHLLEAGARAGVRHHVVLSIVGIDRVDFGYYEGKRRQEQLVRDAEVPFTILRATQFHEFADQLLARTRGPVAFLPRMRVQPVAAADVGNRLAELAVGEPLGDAPELAGPEVHEVVEMARQVASRRGRPRRVLGVPVPGAAGRAMARGALLPMGETTLTTTTFAEWLSRADG